MTFIFCFGKLSPVTFHPLHYQLVTITLHKISICHKLQHYNDKLLTDTFTVTVWFLCWKILCVCFVQKLKGQTRTGCKLRMWTVVMFASLPHAVNFFSKPTDQYYIAVAFLYLNMLQAVQYVQHTVRQNKYSSQFISVTFDGSCNGKKQNLVFALPITECIYVVCICMLWTTTLLKHTSPFIKYRTPSV